MEEQAQALLVEAMTFHQMGDYQGEIKAALAALSMYQQTGSRHNEITALQLAGNGALGAWQLPAGIGLLLDIYPLRVLKPLWYGGHNQTSHITLRRMQ